ncbi:hypothetical protein AVEN_179087-1 [Araneus ventricosus]|uniref:Uncharacterized protein n=1 Tax=Araneus ventricosus TaxID=182803 RepID=A0A4Y2V3K3_ARAVE|nr:hypothetical protein AVEN_102185-1 [Araneus ventricosus]GBO19201.1 hypothetical protein AVEN_179087-1 [Araneus ventricosus]
MRSREDLEFTICPRTQCWSNEVAEVQINSGVVLFNKGRANFKLKYPIHHYIQLLTVTELSITKNCMLQQTYSKLQTFEQRGKIPAHQQQVNGGQACARSKLSKCDACNGRFFEYPPPQWVTSIPCKLCAMA